MGFAMNEEKRKLFSVFDILIILIVATASVFALLSQLNRPNDDLSCVIRVEGEVVHSVSLDKLSEETQYVVSGELPVTVVMNETSVYVSSASCPDKLCEHTGKIERAGQSIVCLPAKVSVTLESQNSDLDVVVG